MTIADLKPLTEQTVQKTIFIYGMKNPRYFFFNTYFLGHEMDCCSISASGYSTEWEIKLSVSDFKAEFKKPHRQAVFSETGVPATNYLNYVVPKGLVCLEDLPARCGLFYLVPDRWSYTGYRLETVGKACRWHTDKVTEKQIAKGLESCMWKIPKRYLK